MSTLMVQGTTSDAGKSTLVTALCRWLKRQGVSVAPFKPQNMALNSAVTADGGEIGRAQAVQAQAAGLAPHSDMNPVLLKPNSDIGAQVIIHGRALTSMDAVAYHDYKKVAMQAVLQSHQRLSAGYPVVMVEGAGPYAFMIACAVVLVWAISGPVCTRFRPSVGREMLVFAILALDPKRFSGMPQLRPELAEIPILTLLRVV